MLFFLQEAIACCRRSFSSYFEDSELTFTAGFSVLQSLSDSDPSKDPYHFFELLGNATSVHGPGPDYHHSLPYCGNVYSRYLSLQGAESDKVLLFVSGDVMASSAILQSHAGRKSRSKFHGEKEGESSRVLQVLSAEGSLCVHRPTGSTFITVSSSKVYTYA